MKKRKDTLYRRKLERVDPFVFNSQVAESFDDMVRRSIPCYDELQKMISRISLLYYREGSMLYDLGCSTGNTLLAIGECFQSHRRRFPSAVAIDKSPEMIAMARAKCPVPEITWTCDGIENISVSDASVIVASFVLQFIPRDRRPVLLQGLYDGLNSGGILILCEKVASAEKTIDGITTDLYYEYKRGKGYSDLEIRQKEKALAGVLQTVPQTWYFETLHETGYKNIEIFFKYLNFLCMIAIK